MELTAREVCFEGVHCKLIAERPLDRVAVVTISGTDVGEFGESPMSAIDKWIEQTGPIDLFIDARDVRGASIEVSAQWAGWLRARRGVLITITMLTGSKFIEMTADFLRRFAGLEGTMRIVGDSSIFDHLLADALRS
jgi:hypothetical protein